MNKSQPSIRCCESRADCHDFWLRASESSLDMVWSNAEDDIYTELLESVSTFEEILSAALSLPPGERAMLADHLLSGLDAPNQKEIDAAWGALNNQD